MSEYKAYNREDDGDADSIALNPKGPFFFDHVSRYWWASRMSSGLNVLDCACGKGYGSYVLSHNANQVVGIDLNDRSLELATKHFHNSNLKFQKGDILNIEALGKKFDLITAFEIIEHLHPETVDKFLQSIANSLSPNGRLLLSTPNHDVVEKSGVPVPVWHINNLKSTELRILLQRFFTEVQSIGQFRRKGFLYNTIFSMDYFNLRHRFRSFMRGMKKDFLEDVPIPDTQNSVDFSELRKLLMEPSSEVDEYSFSPYHWRQAGLAVAICQKPKS